MKVSSFKFVVYVLEHIFLLWLTFSLGLQYHQRPVWMIWKIILCRFYWWVYMPLRVSILHQACQVFNWGLVLISELILSCSTSVLSAGGLNWQCKEKSERKLPLYFRISLIELTDYTVKGALGNWQGYGEWKKWQNSFRKNLSVGFCTAKYFKMIMRFDVRFEFSTCENPCVLICFFVCYGRRANGFLITIFLL